MVPILLLTGFLGSGKTTLLNRLLDARPTSGSFAETSGKLALIVNEFGDVGIDGDLLPSEMTRQIEIKGGCICCRLDEDLEKTLNELLDTQELSGIIIETTGIAEPLPISWTLSCSELVNRVRLAAVITVVDALEHEKHRPLSPSVDEQVEYADILVMSKVDISTEAQRQATESSLRERNEVAPLLRDSDRLIGDLWQLLADPSLSSATAEVEKTHRHAPSHEFDSIVVPIATTLDYEILTEELESLGPNYVRIKGIAKVVDGSTGSSAAKMVAFHRVGARVSCEPVSDELQPRVVAIGSDLDSSELAGCLDAAQI